jgi:hypothetical protein
MTIVILLAALTILVIAFVSVLLAAARKRGELRPNVESIGLGAVTNFFDTLGIGSFAPTTAWLKFRRMVPDSFIPATLNVGHALPTIAQSAIFLVILGVHVDPMLLASCIIAAVAGAVVGVPIVVRAPVQVVQAVVGVALLIAAGLYAMSNLDLMPIGGDATSLPAMQMTVAIAVHFILGALMAFGIGLYAPSLILLSLLGLDPRLAFPIMASACAFLMPTTGFKFMRTDRINLRIVLGIALEPSPKSLPRTSSARSIARECPGPRATPTMRSKAALSPGITTRFSAPTADTVAL